MYMLFGVLSVVCLRKLLVLEKVSILYEVLYFMLYWNFLWWCKGINYLNMNYLNVIYIWYRFIKSMCKICDWWSVSILFIIDCKIDNVCI